MLEFGKPKREITDPGLHYKVPFIQNVEYFDKRILDIDTASQEVIASDQKRLVVDAFARYRITDPLLFFQSVRDERIANSRLGAILEPRLGACWAARASTTWCAAMEAPMRCFPTFSAIEWRGCPTESTVPHWKEPNREGGHLRKLR